MSFSLSFKKVIVAFQISVVLCSVNEHWDLSWPYSHRTLYLDPIKRFNFTTTVIREDDGSVYVTDEFCMSDHGGTHFNAPFPYNAIGADISQIPISKLIIQCIVVDVGEETDKEGSTMVLRRSHLKTWESKNGIIPSDSVVLIRFGWSRYYPNRDLYLGPESKMSFPIISLEAANTLVAARIAGVGVDTASVDLPFNPQVRKLFGARGIYSMVNLKIPEDLPATNVTLFVAPLNIEHATSAPARIFAVSGTFHHCSVQND